MCIYIVITPLSLNLRLVFLSLTYPVPVLPSAVSPKCSEDFSEAHRVINLTDLAQFLQLHAIIIFDLRIELFFFLLPKCLNHTLNWCELIDCICYCVLFVGLSKNSV